MKPSQITDFEAWESIFNTKQFGSKNFFVIRARSICAGCTAACRLIVLALCCSNCSHSRRQTSPCPTQCKISKQRKVQVLWARKSLVILPRMSTSALHFRVLLHAVNLRHGTDSFTSPLKEGALRIISPLKIRRLQPGSNPRTWVLKTNTLPLDHRSRFPKT